MAEGREVVAWSMLKSEVHELGSEVVVVTIPSSHL